MDLTLKIFNFIFPKVCRNELGTFVHRTFDMFIRLDSILQRRRTAGLYACRRAIKTISASLEILGTKWIFYYCQKINDVRLIRKFRMCESINWNL